ncbi:UBX domain-containing protein 1 [Entomophthora muscae]|uniref:UBX domain-containing protein 1 n=1 Tax=Entomophthora muscae TaxID=34485 RepID=A0ACC2S4Q7_9FUNG|nr:UBX domain-containing protein 1 [Entomophthora muscae]
MSFWYNNEDPIGAFELANDLKMPLLVFTADDSELSKSFDTVFSSGKADQVISGNYIALKLTAGTPEFKSFTRKLVLGEKSNVSIFVEGSIRAKIDNCDINSNELVEDLSTAILTIKRLDAGESVDSVRESLGPNSGTTLNLRPLSEEEKVKKKEELRVLVEKRRAERLIKEKEEEKEREAFRREQGKTISAAKQQQQEKEAKMILEKKLKEKQEDRLAKQRVREQIAQDKAERAARRQKATQEPIPVAAAPVAPKVTSGDFSSCKLGIRLLDGSTQRLELAPSTPLGKVRESLPGVPDGYGFILAYPQKKFSESDEGKTLLELGLCPSNSLILKKL